MADLASLEPLQVSDVRDDDYWNRMKGQTAYCDAVRAWMRAHNIDPNEVYRWELFLLDAPFLKVYAYQLDEHGHIVWRPVDADEKRLIGGWWDPVKREPYIAPVSSLPPPPPALGQPQEPTP
ncbi:hypothetical protein AB0B89_23690 [Sphaerisporangium sp. NPDC049002]|uniref:hypothetical protein n=1 Tax=Sphaerisporangium sp. NPDC049002 TaxID=3155392 RepID=UPI0033C64652